MIALTKKENLVLSQIKVLEMEFPNGISENRLKMSLDLTEHEMKEILDFLESKNMISCENNVILPTDNNKEINTVLTKKEAKKIALDQKEQKAIELIKDISNEKNEVSRYLLEGNILYGKEKTSNFRMYHIILSLENKEIIERIMKKDGEYYRLIE